MSKQVKKSTTHKQTSKNFTSMVFYLLEQGLSPAKICDKLGVSKQKLNYYITTLKQSGFIKKIGYGVWEISKDFNPKQVKKSTKVAPRQLEQMTADTVRGHAFQFVLKLPTKLAGWDKREEYFNKTGFKFNPLMLGGTNRGQRIKFKGKKIWLTDNSIIIYERNSFMAETAELSKDFAISSLMEVVRALERQLRADFSFGGKYKFKISRQHYALVKNALAKQYDKNNKKLQIYNETGLWFLIDNSYNLHEAETVHSKTAVKDNEKVQNFFNGLKETENYTPAFVINTLAKQTQNLDNYAVHLKSHVKSVQDLGAGVAELVKVIKDLKKEVRK